MKKLYAILFGCFFLLASCAKIVVPVGGPRDTTPPSVTKVIPENGSVHFNGKQIKITFDEFVELNNPLENAIFSPPLQETPEFLLTNKSLTIKLKDSLKSNMTYNIVFSDCIKDFTEGNKLSYYHYTFSTGDQVDSFYLNGVVTNAQTLEAESGCFVFLYDEDIDSLPMTTRPIYVTKAQSDGRFIFENIAEKDYKVFALKDINSNLLYDLSGEGIAFNEQMVKAKKMTPPDTSAAKADTDSVQVKGKSSSRRMMHDSTEVKMLFFVPADTVQKLVKITSPQKGKYVFNYKLPIYSFEPEVLDGKTLPEHYEVKGELGDTVIWYMKTMVTDTIRFVVHPSEDMTDTLTITPFKKAKGQNRAARGARKAEEKPSGMQITSSNEGDLYKPLTLHFPYPIRPVDSFEVTLFSRKKSNRDTITQKLSIPDTFVMSLPVPFKLEEKVPYTLFIRDSVFYGYDGAVNDTLKIQFTTKSEKDYGNLTMQYIPDKADMDYVVLLLGRKDAVIKKDIIKGTSSINYNNLEPGQYKIKVIEDRNRNGRWDTGSYYKKEQPEAIFFFNKGIDIKGYWDLEETFDFKEVRKELIH